MRVLLLSNEYPPHVTTGQGVHVEYLSRELKKYIDLDIRTFQDQDINEPHLRVKGYNAELHDYNGCSETMKQPLQRLSSCVDALAIDKIDADVVHCHTSDTFMIGMLCKILYKLPLVLTIHSLEARRPWRRESNIAEYDYYSYIESGTIALADKIIAVSNSVREDILKIFPQTSSQKIDVINNGIDVNEYKNTIDETVLRQYGIDVAKPYVLFIGSMTRQKGLHYLLDAMQYLPKGVQLVICSRVSAIEEDFCREVMRKVNELNSSRGGIILIDKNLKRRECINLYSSASVFCCPSIYEPFGIINLEALACSTPVVASSIGGIREVVIQGEGGFLVEPGLSPNPPYEPFDTAGFSKRMSDAINRLIKDKHLRERMGLRGRERVEKVFSWEQVAAKTLNLYNSFLPK